MRPAVRTFVTATVGLVVLVVVASGSAAAVDCGDEEGIVAEAGGDELENGTALYAGARVEVVACDEGERQVVNWVENASGLEVVGDDDDVYRIELTGEEREVDLADAAGDDVEAGPVLEVLPADDGSPLDVEELDASLEQLNETTAAIGDGESSLRDGAAAISDVEDKYERMTETRENESASLIEGAVNGGTSNAFDALEGLNGDYEAAAMRTRNAVAVYESTVEDERADARSTVRLFVGGPLFGGLVVGLVAGAAVPLLAARRVEEKLKLSRNVDYDPKAALVPIAIGLLVAIVGVAVLVYTGGSTLLEVIR